MDKRVYALVAIENRHYKTDKLYTYAIPDSMAEQAEVGFRVMVPFGYGNKKIQGYIMELISDIENIKNIKDVHCLLGDEPLLSKVQIELIKWMCQVYVCFYIDAINTVVPSAVRSEVTYFVKLDETKKAGECTEKQLKLIEYISSKGGKVRVSELETFDRGIKQTIAQLKKMGIVSAVSSIKSDRYTKLEKSYYLNKELGNISLSKRANKQKQIIDAIEKTPGISGLRLKELGIYDNTILKTLIEKEYIRQEEKQTYRDIMYNTTVEDKNILNNEQQRVMIEIEEGFLEKKPVLLHGITGSGKTEIYLELIEKNIAKERDAIVLVPEISLTPQIIGRFKNRFGSAIAIMHSGLSEGEKADEWQRIKKGLVRVAIGARSAIFAPFRELGLIIIDEEHENTYKSENSPKYLTKEVAIKRCELEGAVLVMGSATPSIESYYQGQIGKYRLVELLNRANGKPLPKIKIVDMRVELKNGNKKIFSTALREEIVNTLQRGEQIILFLNRRGYSTFVSCRECGYVLQCPSCSISLTYHMKQNKLSCHYCGYNVAAPNVCPNCKSNQIKYFGIGTQKIEEEFQKEFSIEETLRMDADTTKHKNSHFAILEQFRNKKASVLIGTQMIAKGHDFPNVTLVGIMAADMGIFFPDYRSAERNFQIIEQVAGRSGRASKEGQVIVQTYNPEHYSITYARNHDYKGFYQEEIALRKSLVYPPFADILNIIVSGENKDEVTEGTKQLTLNIKSEFKTSSYELLGPTAAPIDRIKTKYRWQIIIKAESKEVLREIMIFLLYNKINIKETINISMDIDPVNML